MKENSLEMNKVESKSQVIKNTEHSKAKKKSKHKDALDYVIIQSSIAFGIMLVLLAVNVLVNGVAPLSALFA